MYKIILSIVGIIYASSPLAAATDSTMDGLITAAGGAGATAPVFSASVGRITIDVSTAAAAGDRRMAASSDPFLKLRALHASLEGTGTPARTCYGSDSPWSDSPIAPGNWNDRDSGLMEMSRWDHVMNMRLEKQYQTYRRWAPLTEHGRLDAELEEKCCDNTRIVGAVIAMRFDSGILPSLDAENKPVVWMLSDGHWKPRYDYVGSSAGTVIPATTEDRLSKICADRLRGQKPESELLKNACLSILAENHRLRETVLRSSYWYAQRVEIAMLTCVIEELEKKMDSELKEYDRLDGVVSELLEGRQHALIENIPTFTSLIEEGRQMQAELIRKYWRRVNEEFPPLDAKRKECKNIMGQMELELELLKNPDSSTPLYVLMGAHKEALAKEKHEYYMGAKAALETSLTPILMARLATYAASSGDGDAGATTPLASGGTPITEGGGTSPHVLAVPSPAPAAAAGCGGEAGGAAVGPVKLTV